MRVLILGGDGYLGWPTAMHLSRNGHEVFVADNYLRRQLALEEDVAPLIAMPNLPERAHRWQQISDCEVSVMVGDLADWNFTSEVFQRVRPEAIVHYAEQPSAPYSMMSRETASLTLNNNLNVTANVIFATYQFCPQAHIVKLGTMGEYGTPEIDIEEGWIDIEHNGRRDRFLYPRQAGSLYHTTKVMDTDLLWFYVRTWGLRVTDLMQGPVYGLLTEENAGHEDLLPCFAYDELFGTALNRFVTQAVCGYPLTVYGKGGQTRGYINLRDTLACVRLSIEKPADPGQLRIFNQFTETFSVSQLAERVRAVGRGLGLDPVIKARDNPRKEKEEHYYNPVHTGLLELGLTPHPLTDDVLAEMIELVDRHRANIHSHKIFRGVQWA